MKQKKRLTFFLSITCIIILIFLFKLGIFESLELKTLDIRFRLFAESETANKDVVIVAIDEKSLRFFKENNIVISSIQIVNGMMLSANGKYVKYIINFYNNSDDYLEYNSVITVYITGEKYSDRGIMLFDKKDKDIVTIIEYNETGDIKYRIYKYKNIPYFLETGFISKTEIKR